MLSLDDRTGNVVTTVLVFAVTVSILYVARGAFFILLLSLLFAYLLEPTVKLFEHSRLARGNRSIAIAQVYLLAFLVLGFLGYEFGPHFVEQIKGLNAALLQIVQGLSDGKTAADFGAGHGLSASQEQHIRDWLAENRNFVAHFFERSAASAAALAARAVWLFVVPILAIFILRDGRQLGETIAQAFSAGRDQTLKRIVDQVDSMLARYIRAQLALSGLSFIFYSASMLILKFPYAVALGFLGGLLEFLPGVGWITSAALFLTIGFRTHAHWIWLASLLVLWRLVQDYVNSPRIMGNNLQLQPLTVLFALMVGTQIAGIAGAYLAVPTVAALRIVWQAHLPANNSEAISKLAEIEA
jgi:predicted PurR-regulated permease PerM